MEYRSGDRPGGRLLTGIFLLVCAWPGVAPGQVSNADFSAGLAGWTSSGNVQVVAGEASIADDGASYAVLYQGAAFGAGPLSIEFEFRAVLSPDVPQGTFPDTFFSSLYFAQDLGAFDLGNKVYDGAIGLLDADAHGTRNGIGTVAASGRGAGWQHFSATVTNAFRYVIPAFELFDLNRVSGDSAVLLDNVLIRLLTPPGLWDSATDLGGGWRWLDWFGTFTELGDGWLYHTEHGWVRPFGQTLDDLWLYTFDLGWVWTSRSLYPWLWRARDGVWLLYHRADTSLRRFYNTRTGRDEAALWFGAADLADGWKELGWFGSFQEQTDGWIYHSEHGWMRPFGHTLDGVWFYTPDLGWLWTRDVFYPWLWRARDGVWLWYRRGSWPRAFYNVSSGAWE